MTRLREARKAKGMSQEALAYLAGVSLSTVRNAERGSDVQLRAARAFARVLGRTLDDLFGEEED